MEEILKEFIHSSVNSWIHVQSLDFQSSVTNHVYSLSSLKEEMMILSSDYHPLIMSMTTFLSVLSNKYKCINEELSNQINQIISELRIHILDYEEELEFAIIEGSDMNSDDFKERIEDKTYNRMPTTPPPSPSNSTIEEWILVESYRNSIRNSIQGSVKVSKEGSIKNSVPVSGQRSGKITPNLFFQGTLQDIDSNQTQQLKQSLQKLQDETSGCDLSKRYRKIPTLLKGTMLNYNIGHLDLIMSKQNRFGISEFIK